MLKICTHAAVLMLMLSAPLSANSLFCLTDACDSGNCDSGNCDGFPCGQYSGRAFLFAWPDNNASDLRLNYAEPLVTDRPDFTEATSTVGRGVTQFELG